MEHQEDKPGVGFTCGEGWYHLIDRLSADLAAIIREDDLTRFRAQQVKEKLGGLRFYAYGGNLRLPPTCSYTVGVPPIAIM
ncbi:hypothetical protein [Phaeobacter gallaeciensis]|uniref:hypothetical protein n=1 Tax=Phaeobacter gallaeciensis TaxID=60890 RepID=UPI00237FC929|nr:hypothetical protein [Phaeobacter gallaeciensis]MDE4099717.1 hypothetical protein [Phaeobacter gallaeciensis]MDE4108548.1 hypothetical protein [Phaeobacter gallaeciensis]MDE4110436.1 hypothetical protein [Phaeobacter gallaeciensis]MDE4117358.1 hypothetical protein [Phaeobacter gallaeciensis]MDE4121831.1 hypothetical protein [Phaeobacter gallaeciensis]